MIIKRFKGYKNGSFYGPDDETIYITWHKEDSKKDAFRSLINDVDHECFHKILDELEGEYTSCCLDRTPLQVELSVGFSHNSFLPYLIKKGFGARYQFLMSSWLGEEWKWTS